MFTFAHQQDVGRYGSHFANDGGATGGVSVCQVKYMPFHVIDN